MGKLLGVYYEYFGAHWPYYDGPRAPSQYKDGLSRYGDFHYKDKTVVRLSYLYNGNSYTGKTAFVYWDCTDPCILIYALYPQHICIMVQLLCELFPQMSLQTFMTSKIYFMV